MYPISPANAGFRSPYPTIPITSSSLPRLVKNIFNIDKNRFRRACLLLFITFEIKLYLDFSVISTGFHRRALCLRILV